MKNKIICLFLMLLVHPALFAQESSAEVSEQRIAEVAPFQAEHARDMVAFYPDGARLDLPPFSEDEEIKIIGMVKDDSRYFVAIDRDLALSEANWHKVGTEREFDIWQAHIHSPEAQGIKVYFDEFSLGAGMAVKVYGLNRDEPGYVGEYRDRGLGDRRHFGALLIPDDTIVIEFWTPSGQGTAPADFPFEVRNLRHKFRDDSGEVHGVRNFFLGSPQSHSSSCSINNSVCNYGAPVRTEAMAVARFTTNVQCTGALITDAGSSSGNFLFITAFHCVDNLVNPETAKGRNLADIDFEFNYASGCNTDSRVIAQRAKFVAGNRQGDYALLAVARNSLQSVSGGRISLVLQGFDTRRYSTGQLLAGIHHARGDDQNYARVQIADFSYHSARSNGIFHGDCARGCSHYSVDVEEGGFDAGSSGTAMLTLNNPFAAGRINGIYTHGDDSCHGAVSMLHKIIEDGRVRCALRHGDDYLNDNIACQDTGRPQYFRINPPDVIPDDPPEMIVSGGGGGGSSGVWMLGLLIVVLLGGAIVRQGVRRGARQAGRPRRTLRKV